jgi:hypothetical protein
VIVITQQCPHTTWHIIVIMDAAQYCDGHIEVSWGSVEPHTVEVVVGSSPTKVDVQITACFTDPYPFNPFFGSAFLLI